MASSAQSGRKNAASAGKPKGRTTKQTNEKNIIQAATDSAITNEIVLIGIFALTVLLFLCNFGVIGVVGDAISKVMFGVFGLIAYAVPVLAFVAIAFGISNQGNRVALRKMCAGIVLFFLLGVVFELFSGELPLMDEYSAKELYETGAVDRIGGGVLSGSLAWLMYHFLGMVGTVLMVLVFGIICAVIITERSFVSGVKTGSRKVYETARNDAQIMKERNVRRKQEAEVRRGEAAVRREEAAAARRQQADQKLKEREKQLRERERLLKEEQARQDAEHILRMDKKVSGVMMDTSLKEPAARRTRDDMHEITLEHFGQEGENAEALEEVHNVTPIGDPGIDFDKIRIRTMHQQSMEEYQPEEERRQDGESRYAAEMPTRGGAFAENRGLEYQEEVPWKTGPADQETEPSWQEEEDCPEGLEELPFAQPEIEERIHARQADVYRDMKEVRMPAARETEEPAAYGQKLYDSQNDLEDQQTEEFTESEQLARDTLRSLNRPKAVLPREQRPQTAAEATALGQEMLRKERLEGKTSIFADKETSRNRETSAGHQFRDTKPAPQAAGATAQQTAAAASTQAVPAPKPQPKPYQFPPISLLNRIESKNSGDSVKELKDTAARLQQTLQTFGVRVTITDISQGPAVTRYELQPEQGVKVSKILGLADDIKLNLAATDIRIEAPIPGKAAIGIEVPNKENAAVGLRELLETKEFRDFPSNIAFAVGKDIAGKVVVSDIGKMPHMLIAGATGSGKSVCINTLIMSILYKAKPTDVKLIMIDPKVVELSVYNGIPHLLIPVVTDPKKASAALQWGVTEMTDRYKRFADFNVRDLKGYNKKVEQMEESGQADVPAKMPQIVIIVDELADLMMVAPGEVEESICRLAQLARAAGIHLIIATQRPSVDVITGLIKANMPSRVAFAVSSGVDSRTILDMNGAEKLLGKGDMLFYPQGYTKPVRMQGAFVSDGEVSDVVDFLKNQAIGNTYSDDIEERIKNMGAGAAGGGKGGGQAEYDELIRKAGEFIIDKDKASIGMLQRVFKIGFNRAARIMDQLAELGVVGEEEGTKPRKVLMTMDEFQQLAEEIL